MTSIALYLASVILLFAQTPAQQVTIPAVSEEDDRARLPAIQQQLIDLLANPALLQHDPFRIALANSNLGVIYHDLGDSARAERCYQKARTLLTDAKTAEHRALWTRTSNNLVSMYVETGQSGKAERLLKDLLKVESLEADDVARIRGTVASLHRIRGQLEQAENGYVSLLQYWEQKENFRDAAVVANNLGVVAFDRKDPATAARRFRQALDFWQRAATGTHPASLIAMANYGAALLAIGEPKQAVKHLAEAVAVAKKWHGDEAPVTAQITDRYAAALEASGDKKQAKQIRAEAKEKIAALTATDPAAHTVDVLDLLPRK